MSARPPKADIAKRDRHVRFVPKADIGRHWSAGGGSPKSPVSTALAESYP